MANPSPRPYSQLDLAAQPDASPWARRHARDVLTAWSIGGEQIDTVELAVSELVTNAIKQTPEDSGPAAVRLSLRHMRTHLLIEVADAGKHPPVLAEHTPWFAEGGRGLSIVANICKQWGYCWPAAGGKVVWCEIPL